jgi:hypothetical protein
MSKQNQAPKPVELRIEQRSAVPTFRHVDKNSLCPCGSGSKFKHCCRDRVAVKTRIPVMVKPMGRRVEGGDGTTQDVHGYAN